MKFIGADHLCIGPFVLDLGRRGLYRNGVKVHLTPKPFETLAYLVEHRDRTVHKHELLDSIWAGTAVTEGVLAQAVREVRRVLGDDADDPAFILTVPREGYRFVGPVAVDPAPPHDAPRPGGARPLVPPALAAVATSLALLLVGLVAWRSSGRSPSGHAMLERLAPVTLAEVSAIKPAFSPDGSQLVYASDVDEPGLLDLFITGAAGGAQRRLTHGANASGDLPTFTADGSAVVFSRFRTGVDGGRVPDLWRVRTTGGEPVLYIREASGAGFSPDGRQVAYTRHEERGPALYAGPVAALERHREIARPGFLPRWSPDSRWIAFTTSNPEGGRGEVWIVSPDGAKRRALASASAQIYGLTWAGSERLVFASNVTGTFHLWEVRLAEATPIPLTSGVGDYFSPTVAPDGSRVAFAYLRLTSDLWLTALARDASRVLARTDYHETPRLSPDGRLAASVVSRADADKRAYVIDLGTGHGRRLSDRVVRGVGWVDARRVALLVPAGGAVTDLIVVGLEAEDPILLTRIDGEAGWPAVRSDLRRVAFVVDRGGMSQVLVRDLDSGLDTVLAEGRGFRAPRWSPDGGEVAWSASPQGAHGSVSGLWIWKAGSPVKHVAADGYGPVWSSDGTALYFSRYSDTNGGAGVWRLDLATGETSQLKRAQRVADFDVVGDQLIYAVASGRSQLFTATLP